MKNTLQTVRDTQKESFTFGKFPMEETLRRDHTQDRSRVVLENDQAVHVICKAEMVILGLVKKEGIVLECSRGPCRYKETLTWDWLRDNGFKKGRR
jgi:hypothetical protein